MQLDELKSIIENILLAADQPVHVGELEKIFLNTAEKKDLQLILEELKEEGKISGSNGGLWKLESTALEF